MLSLSAKQVWMDWITVLQRQQFGAKANGNILLLSAAFRLARYELQVDESKAQCARWESESPEGLEVATVGMTPVVSPTIIEEHVRTTIHERPRAQEPFPEVILDLNGHAPGTPKDTLSGPHLSKCRQVAGCQVHIFVGQPGAEHRDQIS